MIKSEGFGSNPTGHLNHDSPWAGILVPFRGKTEYGSLVTWGCLLSIKVWWTMLQFVFCRFIHRYFPYLRFFHPNSFVLLPLPYLTHFGIPNLTLSVLGSFLEVLIWKSVFYSLSFGPLSYLYCNKLFENCDWCNKV